MILRSEHGIQTLYWGPIKKAHNIRREYMWINDDRDGIRATRRGWVGEGVSWNPQLLSDCVFYHTKDIE